MHHTIWYLPYYTIIYCSISTLEISLASREISQASGMDFPIPPLFWLSTDTIPFPHLVHCIIFVQLTLSNVKFLKHLEKCILWNLRQISAMVCVNDLEMGRDESESEIIKSGICKDFSSEK